MAANSCGHTVKVWGSKIGDDKKYSVPQKTWFAVLLAAAVWAGVILIVVLLAGLFRGAPSAGETVSSLSETAQMFFRARS